MTILDTFGLEGLIFRVWPGASQNWGGHGSIIGPRGICRECGDVCLKHCETWTEISSKSVLNASDAISTWIDDGLGWNSAPVFVGASAGLESIGVKTADLEGMFLNRKGWFKRAGALFGNNPMYPNDLPFEMAFQSKLPSIRNGHPFEMASE